MSFYESDFGKILDYMANNPPTTPKQIGVALNLPENVVLSHIATINWEAGKK